MRWLSLSCASWREYRLVFLRRLQASAEVGVIVLADGGNADLDEERDQNRSRTRNITYPTKIFFGPGDTASQQSTLQDYVRDLED